MAIDASHTQSIAREILETIEDFITIVPDDNVKVEWIEVHGKRQIKERRPTLKVIKERLEKIT